jgi:hypothetical protein
MMIYEPRDMDSRKILATAIIDMLKTSGFKRLSNKSNEQVWQYDVKGDAYIRVYTSIRSDGYCRSVGSDAIRVAGVYEGAHHTRGITRDTRINRVGEISVITDRILIRIRNAWRDINARPVCPRCGAITFVSKAGKSVCAAICWERK